MKSHTLQGITKAPSTYKKADVKIKKPVLPYPLLSPPVHSPFYTPPLAPTHSTAQIPNTLTLPAPMLPGANDSPRYLLPYVAYPIYIMPANSMGQDIPWDPQVLKEHIFNNQARIQELGGPSLNDIIQSLIKDKKLQSGCATISLFLSNC